MADATVSVSLAGREPEGGGELQLVLLIEVCCELCGHIFIELQAHHLVAIHEGLRATLDRYPQLREWAGESITEHEHRVPTWRKTRPEDN